MADDFDAAASFLDTPGVGYVPPAGNPIQKAATGVADWWSNQPSWLDQATEQTEKDIENYKKNGIKGVLADTGRTQDLASGFAGSTTPSKPFYSAAADAVNAAKFNKANAPSWLGYLRNQPGVKADELNWLGTPEFLQSQKGQVTKDQLAAHMAENQLELKDVTKGKYTPTPKPVMDALESWLVANGHETEGIMRSVKHGGTETEGLHNTLDDLRAMDAPEGLLSRIEDHWYSDNQPGKAKFGTYTLPGGENYREMLITMPTKEPFSKEHMDFNNRMIERYGTDNYWNQMSNEDREAWAHLPMSPKATPTYKSQHWDEPNVLAHVRFNDRDIGGKKTLFIEEVQSDWHQAGKRSGYQNPNPTYTLEGNGPWVIRDQNNRFISDWNNRDTAQAHVDALNSGRVKADQSGVPDAPFKTAWPELAMKRMLKYAADNGYDQIAWTPGEVQAARYDLSKHISDLRAIRNAGGQNYYTIDATLRGQNGRTRIAEGIPEKDLADHVGKEMADKIVRDIDAASNNRWGVRNQVSGNWSPRFASEAEATAYQQSLPEATRKQTSVLAMAPKYAAEYSGLDLKIGGEGMLGFYDDILPSVANKLGKKYGARVQQTSMPTGDVSNFDIVPSGGTGWRVVDTRQNEGQGTFVGPIFRSGADAEQWLKDKGHTDTTVHVLPITDALKRTAKDKGFPLFKRGGAVRKADGGDVQYSGASDEAGRYRYGPAGKHTLDLTVPLTKDTQVFGRAGITPDMFGPGRSNYDARVGVRTRFASGGKVTQFKIPRDVIEKLGGGAHHIGIAVLGRMMLAPSGDGELDPGTIAGLGNGNHEKGRMVLNRFFNRVRQS